MATRSAGRVTIRVIPDSTLFRADLKKSLDRIEKVTKVTIPVELAVTRESVRKLKEQLRDLEVKIKVEPYVTKEALHDIKQKIEDLDPDVRVGLNTAVARARLAALTRPRTVPLIVRVRQSSLNAAIKTLEALSGARFLGNVFDKFWDSIKNLDKSAPRIALLSTGLVGLAGVLGAAVSNAAGLLASLAQLGQFGVVLPALFTSTGIAIGVLIAVLKDGKEVLKDLGPAFTNLQDSLSANYWDIAAQPIRDLVNNLMPHLKEQLINTAQSLGVMTRELAKAIGAEATPERLDTMFDNMNQGINYATGAIAPLVAAFTQLGLVGTRYLPRLGQWMTKLATQFNDFIQEAAASGELEEWAEAGIQAFKDLGRVVKETVRVFAALSRAAQQAGGSGFAQLADGLKKLADTMNSANFQTTFITILASAHDVVDGLIDGLNRLGPGLANFAPTIARVFDQVGKVLGQVGENIGKLLSTKELQDGIEHMFSGLLTFITDLKPAMEPLGQIIGTIADIIGTLLSHFGLLLADVAPYAADFFKDLWDAIKPLIPTLTEMVRDLLPPFADILKVLAKEVLPEVVPLIKELAPIFVALLKALAPVIVEFLKDFAKALRDAEPYIGPVAKGIKDLTDAFKGLPLAFYQKSTGDNAGFIGTMAKFMTDHPEAAAFLSGIGRAVEIVGQQLKNFGDGVNVINFILGLGAALTGPANIIRGVIDLAAGIAILTSQQGAWDAFWGTVGEIIGKISPIGPAFKMMSDTIQIGIQVVTGMQPVWETFWNVFHNPVQIAMTLVTNELNGGMGRTALGVITGFVGIYNNWVTRWPTLLPAITNFFGSAAGLLGGGFPGLVAQITFGMINMAAEWGRGFLNMVTAVPGWFNRMGAGISAGIAIAVGIMMGLPGRLLGALGGAAGDFFQKGVSLLQNFAAGITQGGFSAIAAVGAVVGRIVAQLPGSPAKEGPLSGRGWSKIRGQHLVEDLALGMKERTDAVRTASLAMSSAVQFPNTGSSALSVRSANDTSNARALVEIQGDYYGATPEKVADEFDKKTRRASLAHQISKVGVK